MSVFSFFSRTSRKRERDLVSDLAGFVLSHLVLRVFPARLALAVGTSGFRYVDLFAGRRITGLAPID